MGPQQPGRRSLHETLALNGDGGAEARESVRGAVLQTIAYADVFDYPLRLREVCRYLVGVAASPEEVHVALMAELRAGTLCGRDGYFALVGRDETILTRQEREVVAATMWPSAHRYGNLIAALPFVRMVTVTGALAADNVDPGADIDYLIVTEVGRLWLCRLLVLGIVRLAAQQGDTVCPNYFLSERALPLDVQTLFAARELAQMVPLAGLVTYHAMRRANNWTSHFLPNADGPPRPTDSPLSPRHPVKRVAEAALRTAPGRWAEQWEMQRKLRKFRSHANGHGEANFSADWCKGHFDGHGTRIMVAYGERLERLGMANNG